MLLLNREILFPLKWAVVFYKETRTGCLKWNLFPEWVTLSHRKHAAVLQKPAVCRGRCYKTFAAGIKARIQPWMKPVLFTPRVRNGADSLKRWWEFASFLLEVQRKAYKGKVKIQNWMSLNTSTSVLLTCIRVKFYDATWLADCTNVFQVFLIKWTVCAHGL